MSKFDFWGWRSKKKENTEPEPETVETENENVESETENTDSETETTESESEDKNPENGNAVTESENTTPETENADSHPESTESDPADAEPETENIDPEMVNMDPESGITESETTDPGTDNTESEAEEINPETEHTKPEAEETEPEVTDAEAVEPAEEVQEESEEETAEEFQQASQQEMEEEPAQEAEREPEQKLGFFGRLKAGLTKTRDNIVQGMDRVFLGYSSIDDDFYEELEEIMIMGDMGIHATDEILTKLKEQVAQQHIHEPQACRELLIQNISEQMYVDEHAYDFEKQPSIVMVIGVNGVGKTTSVGKLAGIYKKQGKKVLIAAADTFRAAAGEQLQEWANRAGVDIISAPEGSDPASVVYDAVCAAKARRADILLCDTAGRLHNKKNLMEELRKMDKIISREYPEAKRENLVVLDGATGQNALSQAREFGNVTDLTGIILTKMDGTSKGGIAIAVQSELHIPVKFIGVGEKMEDLQKFKPDEFVAALFEREKDSTQEQ